MPRLSELISGRSNNYNLIRITAAVGVLVSHSVVLAIGAGAIEPLGPTLGMSVGSIAVDIFFVASGFLVTGSLLTRQSAVEFVRARVLRIYPALLVMVLLTVFGLGVFFTTLPLPDYLSNSGTYRYLWRCAVLVKDVVYELPGVFADNPNKSAVNGSLWTLPYEIKMYAILAILWVILRVGGKRRLLVFKAALVALAGIAGFLHVTGHFIEPDGHHEFGRLLYMFFAGAAFYVLRDKISLSRPVFWCCAGGLLVAAIVDKQLFFVAYSVSISYIVLYLAYIPAGAVRAYNRLGDYSYGMYIYAFPVQQSVAALVPNVSAMSMFWISMPVTGTLAVLSWHLLERRALALKDYHRDRPGKLVVAGK